MNLVPKIAIKFKKKKKIWVNDPPTTQKKKKEKPAAKPRGIFLLKNVCSRFQPRRS